MRRSAFSYLTIALLTAAMELRAAPVAAPATPPTSSYTVFPPLGDATVKSPLVLNIPIPGQKNPVQVPVPDPNGNALAKFNPNNETAVQASARKAAAIQAAVQAAVAAGTLPNNLTVTVTQNMMPGVVGQRFNPITRRFEPVIGMVPGMSQVTFNNVGAAVTVKSDPTKQAGGALNFNPGTPQPVQPPRYRPSMSGTGSSSGLSTGLDPSGGQSVLGFGFYDSTSSNPTLFTAGIFPTSGETDAQAFSDLAATFNSDFASDGYTLSYDPSTDTLSLDELLPWSDTFWFADSDTGLNISTAMTPSPEPAALFLMGGGLLGLGAFRRGCRRRPQ